MVGLLGWLVVGVPHLAVRLDVAGCGLRVDGPVVATEGLEGSETFGEAGDVEQVIEGVFDLLGVRGAVAMRCRAMGR
jgi:hypothetical protein